MWLLLEVWWLEVWRFGGLEVEGPVAPHLGYDVTILCFLVTWTIVCVSACKEVGMLVLNLVGVNSLWSLLWKCWFWVYYLEYDSGFRDAGLWDCCRMINMSVSDGYLRSAYCWCSLVVGNESCLQWRRWQRKLSPMAYYLNTVCYGHYSLYPPRNYFLPHGLYTLQVVMVTDLLHGVKGGKSLSYWVFDWKSYFTAVALLVWMICGVLGCCS